MSNSKKPRKAYKPKGKDLNLLNSFFGGLKRVDANNLQVMQVKNHAALAQMTLGSAGLMEWNTIVDFINTSNVMCERGLGDEYRDDINAAKDAAFAIGARYNQTRKFSTTESEIAALTHALDIYEAQIEASRIRDIEDARAEVDRRLRYNINTKAAPITLSKEEKLAA